MLRNRRPRQEHRDVAEQKDRVIKEEDESFITLPITCKDVTKKERRTRTKQRKGSTVSLLLLIVVALILLVVIVVALLHEAYYNTILNRIHLPILYLSRPSNIRVASTVVLSMHKGLKFTGYLGFWLRSTKQAYAARHSYAYVDVLPPEEDLHPLESWQHKKAIYYDKLRLFLYILEHNQEHLKYILWLDGDAVVAEPRISVEERLRHFQNMHNQNELCMVWAKDSMGPNAGIILLVNTPLTRDLIRSSLAFEPHDKTFSDQAALTELIASTAPKFSDCVLLLDNDSEILLQSRVRGPRQGLYQPGHWILHLPNHNRWELLKSLSNWLVQKKQPCTKPSPLGPPNLSVLSPERRHRYDAVRSAIQHSWHGYARTIQSAVYDDVDPVTGQGQSWLHHATTLHDALDTLYLAQLDEEFHEAVALVTTSDFQTNAWQPTKTFEYSLRIIGGLLGAYSVSGKVQLLRAAVRASDAVLAGPFAWSPTALPRMYDILAPQNSSSSRLSLSMFLHRFYSFVYRWGRDTFTKEHHFNSLAGVGSFSVEFNFLSQVTGKSRYQSASNAIFQHVVSTTATADDDTNEIPNSWNVMTGIPADPKTGLASGGDSFYEYLLKAPLMHGCNVDINSDGDDDDDRNADCTPMDRRMLRLYKQVIPKSLSKNHVTKVKGISYPVDHGQFHHLLCFLPGLLALDGDADSLNLAQTLVLGCHDTYQRTKSGLGPERVRLYAAGYETLDAHFFLRPEHVESLFILYRTTGDAMYQDMAWNIFTSLEQYCKTEFGYNGLADVNDPFRFAGVMPSYFLAETLKYLLLLFGPDDYVSLHDFVFTTEGHPLRRGMEHPADCSTT